MGGGLMQLVAYGAQDIYLTGNPQITFFKVVYRRHTNFSMEAIKQTWNGTSLTSGRCTATISRNGDLVYRMYIEILENNQLHATHSNPGAHFVDTVELEIGGQLIDKHRGQWMETWAELTEPNPTGTVTNTTFTHCTQFQRTSYMGGVPNSAVTSATNHHFFIPLQFWFCRNPGLALPLIALQYHEVKVKMTFEELGSLVLKDINHDFSSGSNAESFTDSPGTVPTKDFDLWCDYIYLDTDERRRFAQVSHEYLIEQVQHDSKTNGGSMELNFNHPVKELIWAGVRTTPSSTLFNIDPVIAFQRDTIGTSTYKLTLNGHDRIKEMNFTYFTRTQVWQHHNGYGCIQSVGDTIAVYSFALKPEEHQPSGTCNFSRIDNAELVDGSASGSLNIYAVNYNVLRIMSGMGGLAYSN